jgi:hypothetical protein
MTKTIPAEILKKTIAYFYLLSYIPPESLATFADQTLPKRQELAAAAGMEPVEYFREAAPEVCRHMLAFHQATREPDPKLVEALVDVARTADKNAKSLAAFKEQMGRIAALPGRAKPENRLHRNKGCRLCAAPCLYGYFTLVSDPVFSRLQEFFTEETIKPASKRTPLMPVYAFTIDHLLKIYGSEEGYCEKTHVGNLAFCLLLLGMAKSRMAFPEAQMRLFQEANQEFIRRQGADGDGDGKIGVRALTY